MTTKLIFLFISLIGYCWLQAQDSGFKLIRNPALAITAENRAAGERDDKGFSKTLQEMEGGSFDPAATKLLQAAVTFTKGAFQLPSLQFETAVTKRTEKEGDVLFVRWSFGEALGAGMLILKDTPYYSYYAFDLHRDKLGSEEQLSEFLKSLIAFGGKPIYFDNNGIELRVPPNGEVSPFHLGVLGSQSRYERTFIVDGISRDQNTFVGVWIGKDFAEGIYPVKEFVPERFPPLPELAQTWTIQRVRAEIGKKNQIGAAEYERDKILYRELVRRGVDQEMLLSLLKAGQYQWLFPALRDAGQLSVVSDSFKTMMLLCLDRTIPAEAVDEALRILKPTCALPDESDVVKLGHYLGYGGFTYLGACAKSRDTVEALEVLNPSDDTLVRLKLQAITAIQGRLGVSPH